MSDISSTPPPAPPLPPVSERAAALAQSIKQRQARPQGHKPQAGNAGQIRQLSVEQMAVVVEWLLVENISYKEAARRAQTSLGCPLKPGSLCKIWCKYISPSLIDEGREASFHGTTVLLRLPAQPGELPTVEIVTPKGTPPPRVITSTLCPNNKPAKMAVDGATA